MSDALDACRVCVAQRAGRGMLLVHPDESIPLCAPHWSWWLAKYMSHHEWDVKPEPPCGAHLVRAEAKEADGE